MALVVIMFFLFITLAASRSANFLNPDSSASVSINNIQESASQGIQINSGSDSDDIRINLSEEDKQGDTAAASEAPENISTIETDMDYAGPAEENPVLDFFNTLATNVSTQMSDETNDVVSIKIDENEHVDEDVSHEITINVEDYPIVNSGNAAVLIYHTHTREAYEPEFEGQYVACGDFRTDDQQYSVCAVGERLANLLSTQYGFSVVHDTTMNEAVPFVQSYDKSLTTMNNEIAQNPSLGIFIDLHRNSIDDREFAKNDVIASGGKEYAKVMFVVGRGDGLTGDEAPDWQSNYALAKAVTDEINRIMPGLAKEPMVKAKRYNQHLSDKSMLIEVGYDANTITQAVNSADIVAQAMAAVLGK